MKGLAVMINEMAGNKHSVEAITKALKTKIKEVSFHGNALHFVMESGFKFAIEDDGQLCCESRYMKCDDDLTKFAGATLLGAEVSRGPNEKDADPHEVEFLHVHTSLGDIVANCHNEHSGCYGGFSIRAREEW